MKMTRRSEERGRASSHTSPEKLPPPLYKNRDQIQIVIHLDRHAKYMYYILHARHIKLVSKCLIEYDDIVKFFCSYDRHRIRPALKLGQFDEVRALKNTEVKIHPLSGKRIQDYPDEQFLFSVLS